MPTARLATIASAVVRCRTIGSGTTGSAARDSTSTASASSRSELPTIAYVGQDSHANVPSTNDTQISSRLTPAAIRLAPR